jgi:hypothetical protein
MRAGSGLGVLRPKAHDGQHLDVRRNLELAQILDVGLKIIGLENAADLVDLHLQRMLRDRDAQNPRRRERRELRRLSGRHLARTRRKHEADGVDLASAAARHRVGTGDAANLDPHGAECSHLSCTVRAAARISRAVPRDRRATISAVPISASAVAEPAHRRGIGGVATPLSATAGQPAASAARARRSAAAPPARSAGRGS